jgi:hypothetical protein
MSLTIGARLGPYEIQSALGGPKLLDFGLAKAQAAVASLDSRSPA